MSDHPTILTSPFGGPARRVQSLTAGYVTGLYKNKCAVDISAYFHNHSTIDLYECEHTGYRFWRPVDVAGNEQLYRLLSHAWPNYYRTERWEYAVARKTLRGIESLCEIGCGRGYFLRSLENVVPSALGLEFNLDAIENKVTRFTVAATTIEALAQASKDQFEAVCAFQVLEHIAEPCKFLRAAVQVLAPGGLMILSTPNRDCMSFVNQEDAFDLPPHHMGHFSGLSFRKIADGLGLDVRHIHFERRRHIREAVGDATKRNFVYKFAALVATATYNVAYRISKEPGFNMVAILQKPI